ncbi:MAG: AEC family transporter [Spirochaetales bacterium]|jgi:predicted permease|nr:AEC family transporter [Spirochaetales bacterium]
MSNFFTGVQGVLTILLMIAGGYILGRRKWFSDETITSMSRLVLQISIPAMMLSSVISTFTREDIINMGPALLVPFVSISFLYALSILAAKIFRIPKNRRGVFRANFAFSNTIFVGIPVNVALFGEQAAPYVTLYYLVNTTLFWTIGVYFIRRDNFAERVPVFSFKTLRQIFTPSIICFIIALFFVMYEIKFPSFFMSGLRYAAALTTPLAILIIGVTLKPAGLRRINPEIVIILLARFVLAPLAILFLLDKGGMELPPLMRKVFLITASMPVMTQIALIAKAYGADHENAGITATITTTVSLLAIPVYMVLFGG